MSFIRNRVLFVLAIVAAGSLLFTGFVTHAPNRLLSGRPVPLWDAAPAALAVAIGACVLALLVTALSPQRPAGRAIAAAIGLVLMLLALYAAGRAAVVLAVPDRPAARTSIGPGCWAVMLCAVLATVDALQRFRAPAYARLAVAGAGAAAIGLLLDSGTLKGLSILHEYASQHDAFARELGRHTALVLGALTPAILIGAPLGVVAARRPALGKAVYALLNLLQTIPSIALFGLLIAPLSALAAAVPALGAIGIQGIGFFPAVLALVLYGLLPVVRNTHAGVSGVDAAVVEAARGMGMTPRQIFWRVEAPLALPVVLAGIRIVLVQTIGLAVVAALIGAGGLGSFVFQGLGQYATDLVLLGAVPTILLALAADLIMRMLIEAAGRRRVP